MPPQSPEQPFLVETFTILTDLDEDRLRLNARDVAGRVQAVVMTRRLLDRFIPLLGSHVEKCVDARLPARLALSMSQQTVRQERRQNSSESVNISGLALSWLITVMQLAEHEKGVVWVLKAREGGEARIFLSYKNIQSALDVLLNSYRTMEWSCDKFPEWVLDASLSGISSQQAVH